MTKIRIETSVNDTIERAFDDGNNDCGWVELLRQFGYALRGLGYHLSEDFDEYVEMKEGQTDKSKNVFDETFEEGVESAACDRYDPASNLDTEKMKAKNKEELLSMLLDYLKTKAN